MGNDRYWFLLGALSCLGAGVLMVVAGVGPEWYSYVSALLAFIGAAAWIARYIFDLREAKSANARADHTVEPDVQ